VLFFADELTVDEKADLIEPLLQEPAIFWLHVHHHPHLLRYPFASPHGRPILRREYQ
jgi:hypothetical protein